MNEAYQPYYSHVPFNLQASAIFETLGRFEAFSDF
jgi:hypothetical protein